VREIAQVQVQNPAGGGAGADFPVGGVPMLIAILAAIWFLVTFWNFGLPGLYFDEANPFARAPGLVSDAIARMVFRSSPYNVPNNYLDYLDGVPRFPIFGGNVYNTVLHAYYGLPLFYALGFSLEILRLFEAIVLLMAVGSTALLLYRLAGFWPSVVFGVAALIDPSVAFAARSQAFAASLLVVLFASIAGHLLLSYARSETPRLSWAFGIGLSSGFCVLTYFTGAFFTIPLVIAALYLVWNCRSHLVALLAGGAVPALIALYGLISIYIISPERLAKYGFSSNAAARQVGIPTFGSANLLRMQTLFLGTFGEFAFVKRIVGSFTTEFGLARAVAVLGYFIVVAGGILRWRGQGEVKVAAVIALACAALYCVGTFALKGIGLHHLPPLILLAYFVLVLGFSAGKIIRTVAIVSLTAIIATNALGLARAQQALTRTGGVHFFNETVSLPATLFRTTFPGVTPVFVDWGFSQQFLFQAGGSIPYVFRVLSDSSDVWRIAERHERIAIVSCRPPNAMRDLLNGLIESELPFHQRDGKYVYSIYVLKPFAEWTGRRPEKDPAAVPRRLQDMCS
jgi:hypothetical protein